MRGALGAYLVVLVLMGSAAKGLAAPALCSGNSITSFASSVIGGYQLAQPERFPSLVASGNIGLYQVDGTTRTILNWPDKNGAWIKPAGYGGRKIMRDMIAFWQPRGGGIFEGGLSSVLTPHVAPSHYNASADSQSGAELQWFASGWHPQLAMLNLSFSDKPAPDGGSYGNPVSELTDRDVTDGKIALDDLRHTTGARLALPYIANAPHAHVADMSDKDDRGNTGLGTTLQSDFATDPFYENSRKLAQLAGGFGLDTPANLFSQEKYFGTPHSEMFRRLIASEIRWANQHHLVTLVYMTIFDTQHGRNGGGPDRQFMQGVQSEVRYLENAGATPSFWVVGQYSNGPAETNMPETDKTPDSITTVANWVARHAATTPVASGSIFCITPP